MGRVPVVIAFSLVAAWGLVWSPRTPAAPPEKIERLREAKLAEKATEVLGGRLTVRLPSGAHAEPRPHSIMAAPEPEDHETRIIFDAGPERLVLLAKETFAFAGEDLEIDVREWLAKSKFNYRAKTVPHPAKGLKAVAITPLAGLDHSFGFVEGICVESTDRTIQTLDVYVNGVAAKDPQGCRALAHEILSSVAPGKRKLQLAAGQRRLYAYSKELEISITVDQNTVAETQDGPDFLVHRLFTIGRLGTDPDTIGVYLGNAPDFKPGAKKGSGTMFGKNIDWHLLPEGKGMETLCDLPIPGDKLVAHVWIHAATDARLAALKKAAETLKLVKSQGPARK
ncbi:MAG: hypothetical protein ACLQLG_13085 [Thermoguttaceae bacterium]